MGLKKIRNIALGGILSLSLVSCSIPIKVMSGQGVCDISASVLKSRGYVDIQKIYNKKSEQGSVKGTKYKKTTDAHSIRLEALVNVREFKEGYNIHDSIDRYLNNNLLNKLTIMEAVEDKNESDALMRSIEDKCDIEFEKKRIKAQRWKISTPWGEYKVE